MNAIAVIDVNQHLDSLREEDKHDRMASGVDKRGMRSRIAAAASLGIERPPFPPTEVVVCPASGQVGLGIDIAERARVGVEGVPRRFGQHMRRQRLDERP